MSNRRDRVEELHAQLLGKVETLTGSDEWLAAMTAAARFHSYSFGNWLLLWAEAEERGVTVTLPAGYKRWQELGRQVRKGERGFPIFAPLRRKVSEEGEDPAYVVTGFRVVHVFDVAQTDGDPIPTRPDPALLTGDGNERLFGEVRRVIEEEGFAVDDAAPLTGSMMGATSWSTRTVSLRHNLPRRQALKTLLHELAHVLMHDPGGGDRPECRGVIEVEAEATAAVVAGVAGVDTSDYSVPYLAAWGAASDPGQEQTLLVTSERIVGTARRILERITTADANADPASAVA